MTLSLPTTWPSLTPAQLLDFYTYLAQGHTFPEIQTLCLCRWENIKIKSRLSEDKWLITHRHEQYTLTTQQFVAAIQPLNFLANVPTTPIRPAKIAGANAIDAHFHDIPFQTYIITDNYYQGFLHTKNWTLLKPAAQLLYPNIKECHLTPPTLMAIFYWITSLKYHLATLYPHFLTTAPRPTNNLLNTTTTAYDVRAAMNAQIRALTGGDITKEAQILQSDTHRALTELDAKAKESEALKNVK